MGSSPYRDCLGAKLKGRHPTAPGKQLKAIQKAARACETLEPTVESQTPVVFVDGIRYLVESETETGLVIRRPQGTKRYKAQRLPTNPLLGEDRAKIVEQTSNPTGGPQIHTPGILETPTGRFLLVGNLPLELTHESKGPFGGRVGRDFATEEQAMQALRKAGIHRFQKADTTMVENPGSRATSGGRGRAFRSPPGDRGGIESLDHLWADGETTLPLGEWMQRLQHRRDILRSRLAEVMQKPLVSLQEDQLRDATELMAVERSIPLIQRRIDTEGTG